MSEVYVIRNKYTGKILPGKNGLWWSFETKEEAERNMLRLLKAMMVMAGVNPDDSQEVKEFPNDYTVEKMIVN